MATETTSKSLRQYSSNIFGEHEIKELQKKKSLIGHWTHWTHWTHTAESANIKVQTYLTDEITLRVAQTVNTEQLQRAIP